MFTENRNESGSRSIPIKGHKSIRIQVKELPSDFVRQSNLPLSTVKKYPSAIYSASQSIDDLTDQLSRTQIDPRVVIKKHESSTVTGTQYKDATNQLIHEVLALDLALAEDEKLQPDHPCFELARQFANKWGISDKAVQSHIKLACGYLKFPVLLLLNPAPKHESRSFEDMVTECKTLTWIEEVLHRIGLELADVMILDACTLLGKDRIEQLERKGNGDKEKALSEAYDVTQKMLQMIKPNIIISCQCSTSRRWWDTRRHIVAQELCSSIKRARNKEVRKVNIGGHMINVVQAYHPGSFKNYNRENHHDRSGNFLEAVFRSLYIPCASWKSRHIVALNVSVDSSIDASGNSLTAYRKLRL